MPEIEFAGGDTNLVIVAFAHLHGEGGGFADAAVLVGADHGIGGVFIRLNQEAASRASIIPHVGLRPGSDEKGVLSIADVIVTTDGDNGQLIDRDMDGGGALAMVDVGACHRVGGAGDRGFGDTIAAGTIAPAIGAGTGGGECYTLIFADFSRSRNIDTGQGEDCDLSRGCGRATVGICALHDVAGARSRGLRDAGSRLAVNPEVGARTCGRQGDASALADGGSARDTDVRQGIHRDRRGSSGCTSIAARACHGIGCVAGRRVGDGRAAGAGAPLVGMCARGCQGDTLTQTDVARAGDAHIGNRIYRDSHGGGGGASVYIGARDEIRGAGCGCLGDA